MDNLIQSFIQESLDLLEKAEFSSLELEKNFLGKKSGDLNEQGKEVINNLFRSIHTIKGNSGLFDLTNVKNLSHSFENILSQLRNNQLSITRELIDVFLLAIDRLREMIQNLEESENIPIDDIITKIKEQEKQHIEKKPEEITNSPQDISDTFLSNLYQKIKKNLKTKIEKWNQEIQQGEKLYYFVVEIKGEELLSNLVFNLNSLKNNQNITILYYQWITTSQKKENAYLFFIIKTNMDFSWEEIKNNFSIKDKKLIFEKKQDISSQTTLQSNQTKTSKNLEKNYLETDSYLKVHASLIEELINLAGEAIIARNELLQRIESLQNRVLDQPLVNAGKKISYLISLLQENLMKTRLQELNILFERVPRLVRELAKETGKEVQLEIEGGNIELDKTLIDAIRDPLTHIIRNAIDHGIESPELRKQSGKPQKGQITIKAFFQGGNVIIKVKDDGKGLDKEKILNKALEKGLIQSNQIQDLSEKEIFDLIFVAGFSTAEKITERSGRGVGMDVVKNAIRSIKGSIEIQSRSGEGTEITLLIPQTLSIVKCLLVKIFNRRYAIPQNQIRESMIINPEQLTKLHGGLVYELRGKLIPVIDPHHIIKDSISIEPQTNENLQYEYLIFLETDQHVFGLLVHDILNPEELMLKPLGEEFFEIPYYAGGSILGDGDAILIFDISGIARSFSIKSNKEEIDAEEIQDTGEYQLKEHILIFENEGIDFGVSTKDNPRIEEIDISKIESVMDQNIFQYQNQLIPILDVNQFFKETANVEIFNRKSFFVIIFNLNTSPIAIKATNIIDLTNRFTNFKEEENIEFISGYAIYKEKTIVILNIKNIIKEYNFDRLKKIKKNYKKELSGLDI